MKFKTTNKDIKNYYSKVFSVGYCDLYDFLKGCNEPIGYNHGVYGWNYDLYVIKDVAITTGYRNLVGEPLPKEFYDLYNKYYKKLNTFDNTPYTGVRPHWEARQAIKKHYYNKFVKMLLEL